MRASDAELDRVDGLLTLAYGSASRRSEVALYLELQPDGWFVIEDGGEIVAVAGCLAWGSFSWLGLVATHPEFRGLGLAKRISQHCVDWSLARGCATIALDASDVGRPVYDRLGFEQIGWTIQLELPDGAQPPGGAPAEPFSARDLDEILAHDVSIFGGDRSRLLRQLARTEADRWFVTRDEQGEISGSLISRTRATGPGFARDAASAAQLLRSSRRSSGGQRVFVPSESEHLDALLGAGFVELRRLAHMRLGDLTLPGRRRQLLAQLSFATG
jgi:GNAT superfamily N-acetyltransferase